MAITDTRKRSSWIHEVGYVRVDGPQLYWPAMVAIFTTQKSQPVAILYANVPRNLTGLLVAGHTTAKDDGELSVGATYSKLVKGKYPSQTIEGEENVSRLREMMS